MSRLFRMVSIFANTVEPIYVFMACMLRNHPSYFSSFIVTSEQRGILSGYLVRKQCAKRNGFNLPKGISVE